MMNTTWDDDGESLFESAWYPIILGAAASWQEGTFDFDKFDRDFDWTFFRADGDQFVRVTHALGGILTLLNAGTTDELFWRDPFTTQFQNQARNMSEPISSTRLLVERSMEMLIKNDKNARRNRSTLAGMRLAAQRYDHLGRRMEVMKEFSDEYWNAYLNLGDRAKVRKLRCTTRAISNN